MSGWPRAWLLTPRDVVDVLLLTTRRYERIRRSVLDLGNGWVRRWVFNGPFGPLLLLASLSAFMRWPTALLVVVLVRGASKAAPAARRAWQVGRLRRQTRALFAEVQASFSPGTFTSLNQISMHHWTRAMIEAARRQNPGRDLVIGRLDADGRVLGLFGPLLSMPAVTTSSFVLRPRMRVDVVVVGDRVLIRKDFRGDTLKFLREWQALTALQGRVNVPAVHHVDERRCRLYRNFIPGRTASEIMVARGAQISYLQTSSDPEVGRLDPASRIELIAARARPFVQVCFPSDFRQQLKRQVSAMHEVGVTGVSHTFQNVVLDDAGRPWFIDFEDARLHVRRNGLAFRLGSRRDLQRLRKYDGEGRIDPLVSALAWKAP